MLHYIDRSQNPKKFQDSKYLHDSDVQSAFVLWDCIHILAHTFVIGLLLLMVANASPRKIALFYNDNLELCRLYCQLGSKKIKRLGKKYLLASLSFSHGLMNNQ